MQNADAAGIFPANSSTRLLVLLTKATKLRVFLFLACCSALGSVAVGQTTDHDFLNRGVARQSKKDWAGAIADYTRAIELNPQNALALNNRGLVKMEKGDLDGALADYDRALQINPRNWEIRTNRGVIKQRMKDIDGAEADYDIAIKLYHKYAPARRNRASIRLAKKDLAGALDDCNYAIEANKNDAAAYQLRGEIAAAMGKPDAANLDFEHASRLDPKFARNVAPLVKPSPSPQVVSSEQAPSGVPATTKPAAPAPSQSLTTAEPNRSVAQRKAAVTPSQSEYVPPTEVEPGNIAAAYDRNLAKEKKEGQPPVVAPHKLAPPSAPTPRVDKIPHIDELAAPVPTAAPKIAESKSVSDGTRETEASAAIERPNANAGLTSGNLEVPSSKSLEQKQPDPASGIAPTTPPERMTETRLASLSPSPSPAGLPAATTPVPRPNPSEHQTTSTSIPASVTPAVGAPKQDEFNVSLADHNTGAVAQNSPALLGANSPLPQAAAGNSPRLPAKRPVEHEPSTPEGYERRAQFRSSIHDLAGALNDYNQAIRLNPRNPATFNDRGNIKRAKHDLDGALADYNRAIELNGANPVAYYNRAMTKQSKGDLEGALADLNPAIKLDPKNAAAFHSRGAVREVKGDFKGALEDYNRAIELDPKDTTTFGNRASVYYSLRQWDNSLKDYERSFEISTEGQDYAHLYVWLIRARSGQEETASQALRQYLAQRPNKSDWFGTVGNYLLGTVTEDDLVAAAASPDKKKEAGQLCEAWFYIGMKKLIAGDKVGAESSFNKSMATNEKDYTEYHYARAELRALSK